MATTRIELPEQLEAYVQYKIESGLYSNGAEVIRDALRHMMDSDSDAMQIVRLREAVQLGFSQIDRGEGAAWSPELRAQLQHDALQRAQAQRKPKPDVTP